MFIKKLLVAIILIAGTQDTGYCQGDFCNAVSTIIRDAPNRFRDIRGQMVQSDMNALIFECGIKVPGTINSRFVTSMGVFYEGAFFQTKNKDEVKAIYDKYKAQLADCLVPQGYKQSAQDNFFPGMEEFKKVVFMPEPKVGVKAPAPPGHVAMEATYSKDVKLYTVVMYIFEH